MENWQLALVVISAILVGTLIPLILQARSTLRAVERVVRDNEINVRQAIREVNDLSARVNRIGAGIEENAPHIQNIVATVDGIAGNMKKLSSSIRTASMVGAAVAPLVKTALRSMHAEPAAAAAPAATERSQAAAVDNGHVEIEREVSEHIIRN